MRREGSDYPTAEQMAELDAVLDRLADGRSYRPSLNGLIRGWRELVAQIEAGYDWSIYEYFNDLHVRAMLQSVLDEAPAVSAWIESEIAALDERFRMVTRPRTPTTSSIECLDSPDRSSRVISMIAERPRRFTGRLGTTSWRSSSSRALRDSPSVSLSSRSSIPSCPRHTRNASPASGTLETGGAAT